MILAYELRVNNWVLEQSSKLIKDISKPTQIKAVNPKHCHKYNPIPLTHDILKGIGLTQNASYWEFPGQFFELLSLWDNSRDIYYVTVNKTIFTGYFEYVHQLQNLYFALTGDDLNIVL